MGNVVTPDVHGDVDALLLKDVLEGEGAVGDLPGTLTHYQHALVGIVLLDVGVPCTSPEKLRSISGDLSP